VPLTPAYKTMNGCNWNIACLFCHYSEVRSYVGFDSWYVFGDRVCFELVSRNMTAVTVYTHPEW